MYIFNVWRVRMVYRQTLCIHYLALSPGPSLDGRMAWYTLTAYVHVQNNQHIFCKILRIYMYYSLLCDLLTSSSNKLLGKCFWCPLPVN